VLDLLKEADRQLQVCNSCRYCEGYCAVFPAVERRSLLTSGDINHIANLCHDCRACYQACMYAPPHQFAVNIPLVLSQVRAETYREYGWPRRAAGWLQTRWAAAAIVAGGLALFLAVVLALGGGGRLFQQNNRPGSFYAVIPYLGLLVPALVVSAFAIAVMIGGALSFWRAGGGSARELLDPRIWLGTAWEAMTLRYLGGGGGGCYYPDSEQPDGARRWLHSLVFYGFAADFAATGIAAVLQDFLEQPPPYPLLSAPVVLGSLGGVAMIVGTSGLLYLKTRRTKALSAGSMVAMDYAFLVLLNLAATTGMLLLVLRGTHLMGTMLVIHLAVLSGLYVTAPYGKFVHFVYRLAALARNQLEKARERQTVSG